MKKIKLVVCTMTFIALFLAGCSGWDQEKTKSLQGKGNESIYKMDEDLLGQVEWGLSEEEEHFYIINKIGNTPEAIPSLYFIEFHYQVRDRCWGGGREEEIKYGKSTLIIRNEIDHFSIDVYSIKDGKKTNTIDLKEVLERECPELQLGSLIFNPESYQDTPCIQFYLEEPAMTAEDVVNSKTKYGYINVETGELSVVELSDEQEEERGHAYRSRTRTGKVFNDFHYDLLEINGIPNGGVRVLSQWEGAWEIRMPVTSLPEENETLYGIFPELREKMLKYREEEWNDEEEIIYITLYTFNDPTREELMRLMLPDGQEINFEGMKISAYVSVDDKEHEIHSFEEYDQYLYPRESLEPVDESHIRPIFRNER